MLIAGVFRDGDLVHLAAAGSSAAPGGAARVANVQSRIGSISKTFTAALVMGLRDEGLIDLDEPLATHLPALKLGRLTPRNLLAHLSGLQREPDGAWWERNPGVDIPTLIAAIAPSAAIHTPLRTFHYSNLGYGLLGALVTSVTGETFTEALTSRICKPLGLDRTSYTPADPYLPGYVIHPHTNLMREEPREDARAMAPAGQIWSTVTDLGAWATFIADPARATSPAVLAPATVEEMCMPMAITDQDSWSSGHSLGFQMWRKYDRVYVGHTGSMPGYVAVLMIHRSSRTAVVAFANTYSSLGGVSIGGLGIQLLTAVLENEPVATRPWRPTATEPPPEVTPLLGPWWWMGEQFDVSWNGELVVNESSHPESAWRFALDAAGDWRCHSGMNDGETLRVNHDAAGVPIELDIATFIFSRDPWPDEVR